MNRIYFNCRCEESPPPYAFDFSLNLELNDNSIEVSYNYLFREQIESENWIEAGLSEEKDWTWKGIANTTLIDQIKSLIHLRLDQRPNHNAIQYSISFIEREQTVQGFISEIGDDAWKIHELIQSVKESALLESPLQIFVKRSKTVGMIEAVFAERKLFWHLDGKYDTLNWESLKTIIHLLRNAEESRKNNTISISWDGENFFYLSKIDSAHLSKILNL